MKRKPRFGGGIGRFARKLIPGRRKHSSWWEVPLGEDELEQPYTRPAHGAPNQSAYLESSTEPEQAELVEQVPSFEFTELTDEVSDVRLHTEAVQYDEPVEESAPLAQEPDYEHVDEDVDARWGFEEQVYQNLTETDEQEEPIETPLSEEGVAQEDSEDDESEESVDAAEEDEELEHDEARGLVLASSAAKPRIWSRFIYAIRVRINRIKSRFRRGSGSSQPEAVTGLELTHYKAPSLISVIFSKVDKQIREALSTVRWRIRRGWLHALAFVLRKPELLQEKPESEQEEIEEIHAEWTTLITPPKEERWWTFRSIKQKLDNLFIRKSVALTVENGVVRIVVFRGKQAIAWGTALPEGDIEQGEGEVQEDVNSDFTTASESSTDSMSAESAEADEDEEDHHAHDASPEIGTIIDADGPRLRSLMKQLGFKRTRLVSELPLYSPLLRFMQFPRIRKGYVQDVIFAELEDAIPFSKDEVDIKWQAQEGERGAEILAIAAQKRLIDNHIRILKGADIQPLASYTRAIALAYASGIPNVILVHLTTNEAGIVLVREGVPRVVHRLELSPDDDDVRSQAEDIAKAVEHVDDYYHSTELRDVHANFSVVLTGGHLDVDDSLLATFEEVSAHQIRQFKPPVDYPEHFPLNEYAANVGLAIADRSRARFGGRVIKAKGPSVNMLSERHLPRPFPVMQVAVFAMLFIAGAAAFNATSQVDSKNLEATTLTNQVQSMERQVRQYRLTSGRIQTLQERIDLAGNLRRGLNLQLAALELELTDSIARMEAITRDAVPQGVALSSFFIQGKEVIFNGTADSYDSVIQYTSNLRSFGRRFFLSVRIVRVEASGSQGEAKVSFLVNAKLPVGIATGVSSEEDDEALNLQDLQKNGLEDADGFEGFQGLSEDDVGGIINNLNE